MTMVAVNEAERSKRRRVLKTLTPTEVKEVTRVSKQAMLITSPPGESEDRDVRPEDALVWLKEKSYPFQRNITESNVIRLHREMKIGRFRPGTQIFFAILPDGREWVLNGHHTLTALARGAPPQRLCIFRKPISSEEEAAVIYSTFDDMKKRTVGDTIRAHGNPVPAMHASSAGAAIRTIMCDFFQGGHASRALITKEDVVESMTSEFSEGIQAYVGLLSNIKGETRKFLKSASVAAVAVYTLRYQPERALAFWTSFAKDDGLVYGRPEKALLSYLRNLRATGDGRKETCSACVLAWNKAYKGMTADHVKASSFKNFYIFGTPLERGF